MPPRFLLATADRNEAGAELIFSTLSRRSARRAGATSADVTGRRRGGRASCCGGRPVIASRESVRFWTRRFRREPCSAVGSAW